MSGARRHRVRAASGGFSLLELLAALAIGSVVLAAIAGLIRNVGLSFEAGTRGVGHAERLLLALERIATDLASTRYVHISGEQGAKAIFNGGAKKLAFISGAGVASGTPGEEIVILEVEEGSDATRLVRRRAPWLGRASAAEAKPRDAVVLLEGNLQISFLYSDRSLVWIQSWADNADLPHYIRLVLRDRATGAAVLEPPVFEIRSDARPSCSKLGATPYCLGQQPASPASQPRSNPR
ncbi:MAG: prepilin-type N-terminal cleavage/methylation domain-containing protein [Microvirga sp.]